MDYFMYTPLVIFGIFFLSILSFGIIPQIEKEALMALYILLMG